jgi:hypothetical protein
MSLGACYTRVLGRLNRRRAQAAAIDADYAANALAPWERRFLSESLLSNTWLDWNDCVRDVLSESCLGTVRRNGQPVAPRVAPNNSLERIRHEVKRFTLGQPPSATAVDPGPMEPTWARPDKLVTVLGGLQPSNLSELVNAFGSNIIGPRRIQLVRNACAHKSIFNRKAVYAIKGAYTATLYKDPIDIIWALDPQAQNATAFESWVADLEQIADLATQ